MIILPAGSVPTWEGCNTYGSPADEIFSHKKRFHKGTHKHKEIFMKMKLKKFKSKVSITMLLL